MKLGSPSRTSNLLKPPSAFSCQPSTVYRPAFSSTLPPRRPPWFRCSLPCLSLFLLLSLSCPPTHHRSRLPALSLPPANVTCPEASQFVLLTFSSPPSLASTNLFSASSPTQRVGQPFSADGSNPPTHHLGPYVQPQPSTHTTPPTSYPFFPQALSSTHA